MFENFQNKSFNKVMRDKTEIVSQDALLSIWYNSIIILVFNFQAIVLNVEVLNRKLAKKMQMTSVLASSVFVCCI